MAFDLKFSYKELKHEKTGEVIKDGDGNVQYEQNDMVALEIILSLVDSQKCKQNKWLYLLSIHDKVREQCRLKNYNQTLDFSGDEIGILTDIMNDVNGYLRDKVSMNRFHMLTWRAIREQLKAVKDKK